MTIDFFLKNTSLSRDPSLIIKCINKNSISVSLIKEGCVAFNSMMISISKYRFANLMIDAATVNTMCVAHNTLSNPFSYLAPFPFHSKGQNDDEWRIEEYIVILESI